MSATETRSHAPRGNAVFDAPRRSPGARLRRKVFGKLPVAILLALFATACRPATARGDGGTLRAWAQHGHYDIAVFTDPAPFVTGPVDVSVLLLDRDTGAPVADAAVLVEVAPVGRPGRGSRHPATRQAATNQLLRAAVFELRDPGRCAVTVHIDLPDDRAQVRFALDVGTPWSPRAGIWSWILWPLPVILAYGLHRRLVHRRAGRNPSTSPSQNFFVVDPTGDTSSATARDPSNCT